MKKFIFVIALLCASFNFIIADSNPIIVDSKISEVTVYRKGAQIKREFTVGLVKGKSVLHIQGIESNINKQSIQILLSGNALIESIQYEIQTQEQQDHSETLDQIQVLKDSIGFTQKISSVFAHEKEMMLSNKNINAERTEDFSITLNNTASVFRDRLLKVEQGLFENELKIRNWKKEINDLQDIVNVLKEDKIKKQIILSMYSEEEYQENISIQFLISEASWEPFYDVKVKNDIKSIELLQRAKVRQNTGIDWENIPLTLTTSNPFISNRKPKLGPYFLAYNNYYNNSQFRQRAKPTSFISGIVTDFNGEPLIGASILIKGSTLGTITDVQGKFTLEADYDLHQIVVSYTGFRSITLPVSSNNMQITLAEGEFLDEVVVTGLASGIGGSQHGAKRQEVKQKPMPVEITESEISTSFIINHPVSVQSASEDYSVLIARHSIDANFHYTAVPKLSSYAYLQADLVGWEDLELLSGKGSIYFNDRYEGKTHFAFQGISDTISLSIGRDEDIEIKRQLVREYSKDKFFGKQVKKTRKWKTTILNSKNHEIRLVVEDHYPVSKEGSIKVKVKNNKIQFKELENGLLHQDLTLIPKGEYTYEVEYEVTHNKYSQLFVE